MRFYVRTAIAALFLIIMPCMEQPAVPATGETIIVEDIIEEGVFILEEKVVEDKKDIEELKDVVNKTEPAGKSAQKTEIDEKPAHAQVRAKANKEIEWAEKKIEMALEAVEQAKKATNIAEKKYYLKKAKNDAMEARNWKRRALAAEKPMNPKLPTNQTAEPRQKSNIQFKSETFQVLVDIDENVRGFMSRFEPQMADAVNYNPNVGLLTTSDGRTIDVTPIVTAVNRVWGPLNKGPVFKSTSIPSGKKVYCITPAAQAALSSLKTKKQKEQVGGVALEVTLDLLSFLGVPGFRSSGSAMVVEEPILISLAELYRRVYGYATDQRKWETLPDELRYPGSIQRIHGFVLDPGRGDVFLVGSPADSPENRIDIDLLIVGLRSVWSDGLTPAVSLDPMPESPGGPQYVRIYGLPAKSTFAKVMVEADYTMKRILSGKLKVTSKGYQSLAQILAVRPRVFPRERFWFYPMPLTANGVLISSTSRSVLFETGIQLLTESEKVVHGGYIGTGEVDEFAKQAADLFTASYQRFEHSPQIKPQGIFTRLHGLVDIVTLYKLMREMNVNYPVLRKISQLPFRRLDGTEAIPEYYPGLNVPYAKGHYLSGGVLFRPYVNRWSLDQYQDAVTDRLEYAVDTFQRERAFTQKLDMPFTTHRPQAGKWEESDEQKMLAGQTALATGQYKIALAKFMEATRANPFLPDAWAYLGLTQSFLGQHTSAKNALAKAREEEPENASFRKIALDIELRANPSLDLYKWEDSTRRELNFDYTMRAFSSLAKGQLNAAKQEADTAILLWRNNPDSFLARAMSRETVRSSEIRKDLLQAIRIYRKLIRDGEQQETAKLGLAFALAQMASVRLCNMDLSGLDADLTNARTVLEELQRAEDEARDARQLDESLPLAFTVEAHARALKVELYQKTGIADNNVIAKAYSSLRSLADQTVERFPNFTHAHYTRGVILAIGREYSEALDELSETVRYDPTFWEAFNLRAEIHLKQNRCLQALDDLERARLVMPNVNPELEEEIRQCHQSY